MRKSTLTTVIILTNLLVTLWMVFNAPWEAVVVLQESEFSINLGGNAVWSAPPAPDRSAFEQTFKAIALSEGDWDAPIEVRPAWDHPILLLMLVLWVSSLAFWVITYLLNKPHTHRLKQGVYFVGWICSAGVVINLILWLILGGWEPFAPISFALAGILFGLAAGAWHYKRQASSAVSE